MRRLALAAGLLAALALVAPASARSDLPRGGPLVLPPMAAPTLTAFPAQVTSGDPVTLSGQAPGAPAESAVQLYESPYPYQAQILAGSTATDATGSFTFTVTPDRNTDYRAVLPSTGSQAPTHVDVVGVTTTALRALPLGRAEVTVVVSTRAI